MLNQDSKIYVAGHQGMVGSAIIRMLNKHQFKNIVVRSRSELDLCDQGSVRSFMQREKPDFVFLAAAKVGGIHANNSYPADFIYQNLMIEANVIHEAFVSGCESLLFLGSSCIYPKAVAQPMSENALLTGVLEPTNEPYAVAKIAGIKLCESYNRQYGTDFRSVMPTNLYGPNDNFHSENSHVIPGLLRRFHEAKLRESLEVVVWGSGAPLREFLHVDDMAAACLHIVQLEKSVYREATRPMLSHINVGSGIDVSILDVAYLIKEITGFRGKVVFDNTKPDGSPRKLMSIARLQGLGWLPKIGLRDGLIDTYKWFLCNNNTFRS